MQQSYFSTQRPAHGLRPLLTALVCFGSAGLLASTTVCAQPTITAVAPQANARAAAGTGPVTITFDQALTAGSAAALKVYSSQRGGLRTRGATPAVVSGSSLAFTPSNYPFVPGETVYSTVTTAAQATAGGALAQARVQQFTAAVGGTGRGNFALASTVAVPNDPNGIAAGDVDNDGDLDLVMANTAANAVTVLRNNGSGTYTIASTVAMPQRTFTVALGDVDGDGDLDVVAAVAGPGGTTVSTRLNGGDATGSGTGTFSNGSDVVVGDAPTFLALGDMDGDGDLDVAVTVNGPSNNGSTVRVCLNGGDGTGSNTGVFSSGSSITVGPNAFALALGDVDNDGDLDLAASITDGVKISLNAGNGTFGGGSTVALSVGVAQSVVLADVNADGYLDLLTELNVRLNTANGSGTFGGGSDPSTGGVLVVAADIDADGDLDMAIASEGGGLFGVKVLFNNGAGGFPTGYDIPLGEQLFYLASADVDGDGDLDLLGAAPKELNSLKVLINGPAAAPTLTSFTPTSGPAGTTVTLNGTNLTGASVIAFGGPGNNTVTTGLTVSAAGTQITGVVVPGGAQTGPIRVTTPGGTATSPASFTVPLPVLTGISPSTGAAGTSVTLTGTNLVGAVQVSFNGITTSTFTSNSATQLVLAVPAGATSGSVTVTTPAGTSNALSFTVPCPVATIAYGATSYCQTAANPTPTVTGPAGGTFNAPTGLSLDAVTGAIALATSTPGTYTVSYTAGTAACPTTATASVTVTAAPVATFAYGAPAYCTNAGAAVAPVLASNATAGTFTAAPAGLSLDANTGALTLASSQPGTYTVTNTVAGSGGCAGVTATTTVVVNAAPTASIAASGPTTFCAGGSVTLTASGGTSYLWSTGATTADITVTAAGAYSVVVTNAAGCSATSAATTVVVNAAPATPTLSAQYNGTTTTLTSSVATGNQFFLNGVAIAGATGPIYVVNGTPAQLGAYTVVTTNAAGCASAPSAPLTVTSSVKPLPGSVLHVYPTPTTGELTVELAGYRRGVELTIVNTLGQVVYAAAVSASLNTTKQAVNLSQLPAGIYILRAKTAGGLDMRRVVKE